MAFFFGSPTNPNPQGLSLFSVSTTISAERIVEANDDTVTFKYTDSATQERKQSTVSADEFMRRYLQHVLPPGQPFRLRSRP